jgi:hypothetical protein
VEEAQRHISLIETVSDTEGERKGLGAVTAHLNN